MVWLQVLQGLIWVWAEPGPLAFIESAASTPILDPMRTQAQNWSYGFKNYIRDVPGWVAILVNITRTDCCVHNNIYTYSCMVHPGRSKNLLLSSKHVAFYLHYSSQRIGWPPSKRRLESNTN